MGVRTKKRAALTAQTWTCQGGSLVAHAWPLRGAVELLHWFLSAALLVRFFDTSVTLAL